MSRVIDAAGAVEAEAFEPASLDPVAGRDDALGQLARVFQRMAREVIAREQRLKQPVQELRIQIDQSRQAGKVAEITESDYVCWYQPTSLLPIGCNSMTSVLSCHHDSGL